MGALVIGALAWAALQVQAARQRTREAQVELTRADLLLRRVNVTPAPVPAATEGPELAALKAEISAMAGELKILQARASEKEEGLQTLLGFKQGELDTANRTVEELKTQLTAATAPPVAPERKPETSKRKKR